MAKAIIVIPFLVSPANLARLNDLFRALRTFEPTHDFQVIVVLDGENADQFQVADDNQRIVCHCYVNPRRGQGVGWTGGIICGLLFGFSKALEIGGWDILLRLDDDAMAAGPFIQRARSLFRENGRIGQLGYYEFGQPLVAGKRNRFSDRMFRRSTLVRRHVFPFDQPNGTAGNPKGWWLALHGWRRSVRRMIGRARQNGYLFGEFCQGGAYFLSRPCLEAFAREKLLENPLHFLGCDFTEDFFFSIATRAHGFDIRYVLDSERFISNKWKGLHQPAEQLIRQGYALVHSVKADAPEQEEAVRAVFRRERACAASPTGPVRSRR